MEQIMKNLHADSWSDLDDDDHRFDDPTKPPLERLDAYVDHVFETYPIVSRTLERERVHTAIADWGRRRGLCKYNKRPIDKREFGKRVDNSHFRQMNSHHNVYTLMVATALVGVPAYDDKGIGWKPTARHEVAHAVCYEKDGWHDHGDPIFKRVAKELDFNGKYGHGYPPRVHR